MADYDDLPPREDAPRRKGMGEQFGETAGAMIWIGLLMAVAVAVAYALLRWT